jgi:site-specific DNA recombinase
VRVVKYARVSTDEQAGDQHHSIPAQLHEMQTMADQRGWEVIGEFVDEGISGSERHRPQLDILLEMAQRKQFDILLVHDLSRLSRSVYDTLDIFEIIGRCNIGFASVTDPDFDFSDPGKRLFLIILAALNQYFLDQLRMHTSKAKHQRARQGLYNASTMPQGYQATPDPQTPPIIIEEEAQVIRFIFEQYATGRYSDDDIAGLLTAKGWQLRTKKKHPHGRNFSKDTVSAILTNEFYIGRAVYNKHKPEQRETYDGQHQAIISEELWDRCQSVRASRRGASRSVQKPYRIYLLSNLAVCDVCGRKLRCQATPTDVTYYREMSSDRGYTDCPHASIGTRTELVDRQIQTLIQAIQLPDDWLEEAASQMGDDELVELQRQRQSLEARRRRLRDMKLNGDYDDDPEEYSAQQESLRRQLAALPTFDQLEGLRSTFQTVKALRESWEHANPEDQRDLLRLMLREVSVDVPNGRVVSVTPLAVFIPIFRRLPFLAERELGIFVPTWTPEQAAIRQTGDEEHPQESLLTISHLPALTSAPMAGAVLPFLAENLLQPEVNARITPGVSHALALCKARGLELGTVVQIKSPDLSALPMDLRRWPQAAAAALSWSDARAHAPESADMLVSQFDVWPGSPANDPNPLIADAHRLLKPGGVWYFQEVLPLDMPAHWLYRYFPAAWELARKRAWGLHGLYTRLQGVGFTAEVKRHLFYQPVTAGAALAIAQIRPGLLARLPDGVYQQGLETLRQAAESKPDDPFGFEVALAEIWAQKAGGRTTEGM